MGLWSGRSTLTGRTRRSAADSKTSSRRRREGAVEESAEDGDELDRLQPDLDELRSRRTEYYSVPAAQRRRKASSSSSVKSSSRRTSTTSSSRPTDGQRRRRRRTDGSSRKSERATTQSPTRSEEYVYAPRDRAASPPAEREDEPVEKRRHERKRSDKTSSKRITPLRSASLPTVFETESKNFETEITPDDSISQVGVRDVPEREERAPPPRPSIKRSRTTSSKLPTVRETPVPAANPPSSTRSSKRHGAASASSSRRRSTTSLPARPRVVECLTCGSDDTPVAQSAKLACGHRMCHDCLKRVFDMSVKDPQHMPPKCCTDDHIPLKHVEKLFDVKFKMLWNRKYQEYHTRNRIYCPTLRCGEWIKPSNIRTVQGRKYALCPRCKTKVCTLCNNKSHKSADCPKDPEIARLVEQAKERGWQRCYNCSALVERKEGCNHMTCRCMAEFCILCGSQWKTCDCPWFNYSNLPDPDRLNHMRVPQPIQAIYRQVFGGPVNLDAPPFNEPPPDFPYARVPLRTAQREVTYQQEVDQRRRQERLDADLARRLQLASIMDPNDGHAAHQPPDAEMWGVGNAAGNFMNDDYVQNAANVIMSTFGDTNLGRRGERSSGRRRRAMQNDHVTAEPGLAPDFLGDQSVLGAGLGTARRRAPA